MTHWEKRQRRQRIAQRIAKGDSIVVVMSEEGVCKQTVLAACHENSVIVPKLDNRIAVRTLEILARIFDARKSIPEIAQELKVSNQRVFIVYREAKDAGIPHLPLRQRGHALKDSETV